MTIDQNSSRLEIVLANLDFARSYTKSLLEGLDEDAWFQPAAGSVTHIGWQVGHLAMAEYGLCLFRQRGRMSEDTKLMSGKFRKLFMKGTTPRMDAAIYPPSQEILAVLDRVHQQVRQEVPNFSDDSLQEALDPPTAVVGTRFGALLMAVNHEMLHAGQIGLIRRELGLAPVR